jgi:hypothetical protein
MHYVYPIGIATKIVGVYFAKSLGKKPLIEVANGCMYFFFLG